MFLFVCGFVFFGVTVLLPGYLQALLGYSARQAGSVLSLGALSIVVGAAVGIVAGALAEARWS